MFCNPRWLGAVAVHQFCSETLLFRAAPWIIDGDA
jgi:hypothetical protein